MFIITSKRVAIMLLFLYIITGNQEPAINLFPMAHDVTLGSESSKITLSNPCSILYKVQGSIENYEHIEELLRHYQSKTFGCRTINLIVQDIKGLKLKSIEYTVNIDIQNFTLQSVYTTQEERYQLNITTNETHLKSTTYVGFVRGIQTFLQTIKCSESPNHPCTISKLPISIVDEPQFPYRGIMIDTARHYLPIRLIYETIDGMMYNKMNVLHWHITDDDSFPLVLEKHPELAEFGAFEKDEVYTPSDVKSLVKYAMIRGVRIIPELATPAHSSSWVRAEQYSDIMACKAFRDETGGFKADDNKTLTLVKEVFEQVLQLFPDKMIHLGGQSQQPKCYQGKQNYNSQYRKKQKQILQQLDSSRQYIYWQTSKFQGDNNDIVLYSGNDNPQLKNKIIFTDPNLYRLDYGVGSKTGSGEGSYSVWMQIYYRNLKPQIQSYSNQQNVLGEQVLLYSDTSNEYTHHIKLWMRSSTVAERLWNSNIDSVKPYVLQRITRHQRVMDVRGIPSAPVTGQICELNPTFC